MNALLVVDLQSDFCPGGALGVPEGDQIIPLVNRLQSRFDLVVASRDWHPASHGSFAPSHPGKRPGDTVELAGFPQTLWPVHCVQNTLGADFHPALDRRRIAAVFPKGVDPDIDSYSALFDNGHRKATGLDDYLHQHGVTEVFICGLTTDYCVKFTALDAIGLGYRVHVILDACRGVNLRPGDVQRAIDEMRAAGVHVLSSHELKASPRRVLAEGKFVRVLSQDGWEWIERINTSGAAVIAAVTADRQLVLIEQYRIPLGRRVIELPAGLVGDDPGAAQEEVIEAARRELLEETGYTAEAFTFLTEGPSSAGLANEVYSMFLARDARKVGDGGGDASEQIHVHVVPLDGAHVWLEARRAEGLMIDPKIYAALYFALQADAMRS